MAPTLRKYVADQVKGEAEVAKEQRKAREEMRFRRRKGRGKGKEEGADGAHS